MSQAVARSRPASRTRARLGDAAVVPASPWGRLAPLTLSTAAGLLLLSVAFAIAESGRPGAEPLYWIAFVVIAVPIVVRLSRREPTTRERVALTLVLGMAFYVARLLRSPESLTGYDELQHLRSLTDILATNHLFQPNPLLIVSPEYPGLEILTAAVVQVSGADPFIAIAATLAAVRVVFVLGLFAMYREAARDDRVAGLAAAIYMLNPNFMFFNGHFAYETLALAFVPPLLVGVAAAGRQAAGRWRLWIAIGAVLATIVVTHHITAFAVAALLVAWLGVRLVLARRDPVRPGPIAIAAAAATTGAVGWLLLIAPATVDYLGRPLDAAFGELVRLITTGASRPLFQSATGEVAAVWERLIGLGVSAMLVGAIPIGLFILWERLRRRSFSLLLGLVALGYPLSLVGRLMPTGSEAAGRSLAYIFLGLAFVVALAVAELLDEGPQRFERRSRRLRELVRATVARVPGYLVRVAFVVAIAATTTAGVILGTAPATRLPGPYLVEADSRSIDDQSVGAAEWLRERLGRDVPIAADRVNRLLLGSYGEADVRFHGSRGVETWQVFLRDGVGPQVVERMRAAGIRYVLIDRRLSTGLPLARFYYEEGEVFEAPHEVPVDPAVLGKWDGVPGVHRIFDSGPIQVYDVGALVDG